MNKTEMLKVAYEIGFQRALIEAGFSKEAGMLSAARQGISKVFPSFAKTGPKNVAGGAFDKFQAAAAAARKAGKPVGKSSKQLMRGVIRPKNPQVSAPSV